MSELISPVTFFLVLGISAILIEVVLLHLTTFWLLFLGIASLLAALFVFIFPQWGWLGGTIVFGVSLVGTVFLLHRPLKRWQAAPSPMEGNDAIGQIAEVSNAISPQSPGKVSWSGTEWQAELVDGESAQVEPGDKVTIKQVAGITLFVAPVPTGE